MFFSNLSPVAGTIASMGTFAVGYLARPLGGVIFGHFGDRHGRKTMLLIAMTLMGVGVVLIGLLPPTPRSARGAPILPGRAAASCRASRSAASGAAPR